jgi:hypothetical protein
LAREEPRRRQRQRSNLTPKAPALRMLVVWALAAREVLKAAEVPPHRRAGSMVLAPADLRRALGHRRRLADRVSLSRLREAPKAT